MTIIVNNKIQIKPNGKTFLIAEISANHCGSKKNFINHILSAHKNGADIVKIQTYEPEDMMISNKFLIKKGLWKNRNLWSLYEKAQTKFEWHHDAFKIAKKMGITLISTPFSLRALNFLKNFNPPMYKISSFEITDHRLISEIAKLKKPIILSTGLSNIKEIKDAIKIIKKYNNKIILLYCVSGYPTPLEDINLEKIDELRKKTNINLIGFSDHSEGIEASIASLSKKICLIERHYTLNKNSNSPDVKFSILPHQLRELKNLSTKINKINFSKNKSIPDSENPSKIFRRSIYSIKNIKKNEKFTEKNIACYRPCLGIGAEFFFDLLGKKAKKNIKQFLPIKKNMI